MPRHKISDRLEGVIKHLLRRGVKVKQIQEEVKSDGFDVSLSTIYRVKKNIGKERVLSGTSGKKLKFPKACNKATPVVINKIKSMTRRVNPPTQREMAQKLGISVGTVNRVINDVIKAKLRKKSRVHQLSLRQIENRRKRSWQLYLKLAAGRWKNIVTTDEAMFYLGGSYGQRRVCYVRNGEKASDKLKFMKRDDFAPGFMVWAGVCSRGKTSLHFIDRKTKVNAHYYVDNVLKPFLRKDLPRLFPGEEKKMIFHQDSASSHTARHTLDFLKQKGVNFITPAEWMPKSPDAAPMDFSIWGILKRRLQKHKLRTLKGLKAALKKEWKDLSQSTINKALNTWPRRCRLIYYAHGSQIEHLMQ